MSDYTMDDFRAEMAKRDVAGTTVVSRPKPSPKRKPSPIAALPAHGSSIVRTAACGIHPLHAMKIRANGARSGCPMCEMQIEDLCRSFAEPPAKTLREHSPRITLDRTRIVGCSCGWIMPPGTADSDTAWVEHATVQR